MTTAVPRDIVQRILGYADLSIDARLALGVKPKKIKESTAWRLWYLLNSHDGIIYNLETKSLHVFRIPGFHVVRRPVELDRMSNWITVVNESEAPHDVEITRPDGSYVVTPGQTDAFYTEFRVLLKGSGLARILNTCNCT